MKHITCAIFAILLTLGLFGCGGKPKTAESTPPVPASNEPVSAQETSPATSQSTSTEAPSTTEWITPVLDLDQQLNEISYQVPSAWKQKADTVGVFYYPFTSTEDVHLYFSCEFPEGLGTVDIADKGIYTQLLDGYAGGLESAGFTIHSKSYEQIAGKDAICVNYKKAFGSQEAEGTTCAFITQTAVYSFGMSEPEALSDGLKEAFAAILQTVTIR